MSGETTPPNVTPEPARAEAGQPRQRSTIAFPYMHLDDAIEVARAIHSEVGAGDGSLIQLAKWLGQSNKSSGLRIQLSAARMFGLIDNEGSERYRLTPLGRRIVDPNQSRRARVDAFLSIPLYRAIYDRYHTDLLPPPAALEREMARLGVAEKQKERARQVFERSAEQAGYFEHGRDRLVEPALAVREEGPREPARRAGGGGGGDQDPLIVGLIQKLQGPEVKDWTIEQRAGWLRLGAMILESVYGPKGTITIEAKGSGSGGGESA